MKQNALMHTLARASLVSIFLAVFAFGGYAARGYFMGPLITISEPTAFTVTESGALTISGKVERSQLLTLNGRTIYTTPDGHFSERMLLTSGSNTFVLAASDTFGTRHEKEITVAFAPHEPGSMVSSTEPAALVLLK